jgi:hemolysin III
MLNRINQEFEEYASAATHGLGLLASVVALPLLILLAERRGDAWALIGAVVFGTSLVTMYAASTVYHALPAGPRKEFWRRLDYASIYFLIAGTYTPFSLGALRGPWGWSLLVTVWVAAFIGIRDKLSLGPRMPSLDTILYVAMGWLIVVAVNPLRAHLGWAGLSWLVAGGVIYTLGVIFFACEDRLRPIGHCVWHLFVLGGSACHAIAVAQYGIAGWH